METSKLYEIIADADEEEVLKLLENKDDDQDFSLRDSHGKTLFHIAVEKIKSVNVFKALLNKVDFTLKDDDGETAIDIMMEDEEFPDDAEDVFRDFVREKILSSKKDDLESLVLKGWLDIALSEDDLSGDVDEEVKEFVAKLPDQVVGQYLYIFIHKFEMLNICCSFFPNMACMTINYQVDYSDTAAS